MNFLLLLLLLHRYMSQYTLFGVLVDNTVMQTFYEFFQALQGRGKMQAFSKMSSRFIIKTPSERFTVYS